MSVISIAPAISTKVKPALTWQEYLGSLLDSNWRENEWDATRRIFFGREDNPLTGVWKCSVVACNRICELKDSRCATCTKHLRKSVLDKDTFNLSFKPIKPAHTSIMYANKVRQGGFDLRAVSSTVEKELLFCLQQRDKRNILLRPDRVRYLINGIPKDTVSLLDITPEDLTVSTSAILSFFNEIKPRLKKARSEWLGEDLTAGDTWDPAAIGLVAGPDRNYQAAGGLLDFRPIEPDWLREAVKAYGRDVRPTVHKLRLTIRAAAIASNGLKKSQHINTPERLGVKDMSLVVEEFRHMITEKGKDASISHKRGMFSHWRNFVNYARLSGLFDGVSGQFNVNPELHFIAIYELVDPESIRVIPEEVIHQMNTYIDTMGSNTTYGKQCATWSTQDYAQMSQTIYKLLRDTGRRPSEICSLKLDCISYQDGKPSLVYDNHKRKRMGRLLPITLQTAGIVENWQKHLKTLDTKIGAEEYLFPYVGSQRTSRTPHVLAMYWNTRMFVPWLTSLPDLTVTDDYGMTRVFPKEKIQPYGLRHSYAQRYADAGVPVDTLRQLMDHRDVNTTMGYYQVSMKRKREAVEILHNFTVENLKYGYSPTNVDGHEVLEVSTPLGNCAEPSNIRAGGKGCGINYNCAACIFYRPDPSYLPVIEQQLVDLRKGREVAVAIDAATWVVTTFENQITAYSQVLYHLEEKLQELSKLHRKKILDAATQLRKVRALSSVPQTAKERENE